MRTICGTPAVARTANPRMAATGPQWLVRAASSQGPSPAVTWGGRKGAAKPTSVTAPRTARAASCDRREEEGWRLRMGGLLRRAAGVRSIEDQVEVIAVGIVLTRDLLHGGEREPEGR